ncbi:uncharacterized protein LOC130297681 [Hyla sarda]|uniref:uncharacterized protein LOC130297681 n=1 Tax=Hyla sarda TaxID=327740 RepID=UPI0024C45218|nr:uncharacterized protein LOC130297681 [Hyla sarda]
MIRAQPGKPSTERSFIEENRGTAAKERHLEGLRVITLFSCCSSPTNQIPALYLTFSRIILGTAENVENCCGGASKELTQSRGYRRLLCGQVTGVGILIQEKNGAKPGELVTSCGMDAGARCGLGKRDLHSTTFSIKEHENHVKHEKMHRYSLLQEYLEVQIEPREMSVVATNQRVCWCPRDQSGGNGWRLSSLFWVAAAGI